MLYVYFLVLPRTTCEDWKHDYPNATSGLYRISPTGGCEFRVYCDLCVMDGEGWIVIQRRRSNDVAFEDKGWSDYRDGFGSYLGNYWMGLEKLHKITSSGTYELFVGVHGAYETKYALYSNFAVASEALDYKLTVFGFYDDFSTLTEDGLEMHDGQPFTTHDRDNDGVDDNGEEFNCAEHANQFYGGWWFGGSDANNLNLVDECISSNLNGKYYGYDAGDNDNKIKWKGLGSSQSSLTMTLMAIRRVT